MKHLATIAFVLHLLATTVAGSTYYCGFLVPMTFSSEAAAGIEVKTVVAEMLSISASDVTVASYLAGDDSTVFAFQLTADGTTEDSLLATLKTDNSVLVEDFFLEVATVWVAGETGTTTSPAALLESYESQEGPLFFGGFLFNHLFESKDAAYPLVKAALVATFATGETNVEPLDYQVIGGTTVVAFEVYAVGTTAAALLATLQADNAGQLAVYQANTGSAWMLDSDAGDTPSPDSVYTAATGNSAATATDGGLKKKERNIVIIVVVVGVVVILVIAAVIVAGLLYYRNNQKDAPEAEGSAPDAPVSTTEPVTETTVVVAEAEGKQVEPM